jgi:A/G-specific adenine glycosylase
LPWIGDQRPWAVLVSEVMLQQTPTSRVIEPWTRFLEHFATPRACADAPLSEVLALWQGLGYPRRAKALHDTARMIRDNFGGVVPRVPAELRTLPGVGEYTAAAVASFAYGERVAVLDTNVGRVLARALANERLSPNGARALAQALLPRDNVAAFNQAMLDLGAQFCRSTPRCASCPIATRCRWHVEGGDDPAPRSAGVSRPQAPYEGSNRQLRGRVLRALREGPRPRRALEMVLSGVASTRRDDVLASLLRDGLVVVRGEEFSLAGAPEASVRDAPLTSTTLMAGGGDR